MDSWTYSSSRGCCCMVTKSIQITFLSFCADLRERSEITRQVHESFDRFRQPFLELATPLSKPIVTLSPQSLPLLVLHARLPTISHPEQRRPHLGAQRRWNPSLDGVSSHLGERGDSPNLVNRVVPRPVRQLLPSPRSVGEIRTVQRCGRRDQAETGACLLYTSPSPRDS